MLDSLFNFYPQAYQLEEFMYIFSTENPNFHFTLFIAGLTFLFGYLEYVYSFLLSHREKSNPFPVWMHTFYLAHDSMGAIVFFMASRAVGGYWFFTLAGCALLIWNLFEVYNLYKCIYVERQEIWGHLYEKVSVRDAWIRVLGQIAFMIPLVNLFRVFMQDYGMFSWFILTNVIMAIFPGLHWEKRGTQVGASLGLAIVIFLGTLNSFHPWNMWVLSSDYYSFANNPWFYIIGLVSIVLSFRGILVYLRLPKKADEVIIGYKSVK